jgi:PKD domain
MIKRIWGVLGLTVLLGACGGGGGDGCSGALGALAGGSALCKEEDNRLPMAHAGLDQSVKVGSVVKLDGSRSRDPDGNLLQYQWQWASKPANSAAVLASADTVQPAFEADVAGTYVLSLVVSDGKASSASANVTVTAADDNAVPVASAGANQTVPVNSLVVLDGTASTDADRQPLDFTWVLLSKPAGSSASLNAAEARTARPTLTPDVAGAYVASLVVSDGTSSSAPAVVTITATVTNAPPVARAGDDQTVRVGAQVSLDGSTSDDANRDPLTYTWTEVSKPVGSAASLLPLSGMRPSFTADLAGAYVYSLVVNDGQVDSQADVVVITVEPLNQKPVAVASMTTQLALRNTTVSFSAAGSRDPEGQPLKYLWTLTTAPAGSTAQLVGADTATPSLVPAVQGLYVLTLVVNDGEDDSLPVTVPITVP